MCISILMFSTSALESILLIFIALGEDLVHFPQGSKLWLGSCFGKSHKSLYKLNHDAYETLKKVPYTYPASVQKFKWLWDHLWSRFRELPKGNWSPNLLVKTPTLNITLNRFEEVIGVRIINPPLSKFGHMSKLGVMSKSAVHPVYLVINTIGSTWPNWGTCFSY